MSAPSLNQENKELIPEPKVFGLPSPVRGALMGIILYSSLILLSFVASLEALGLTLLSPGLLAAYYLNSRYFGLVLLLGLPSIPFALFGFLIFSNDGTKRVIGIIWLIIYFALLTIVVLPVVGSYLQR
jgi:hypothetical protein